MGEDKPAERFEHLEPLIFTVRRQRVILDADLRFRLAASTRRPEDRNGETMNWSQFATSSASRRDPLRRRIGFHASDEWAGK
ncbi:MAG TPA: hypothetical protein VKP89_08475 [Burkholderiales bacterium]|nr:hypothetical protein [Burkholderiales bacterium]